MSRAAGVARLLTAPQFAAPASVAVLAFLASATSLVNGYVYDDRPIVSANPRVHTLERWWEVFAHPYWPPDWGDTNYRPLTILSFAVQWALGDGSPRVFHATNVVLYLAVSVAVFRLAALMLPRTTAWLVGALFAVHPVHVEAVGNVVGQSEIVVALCSTLAVAAYLRLRSTGRGRQTPLIAMIALLYAAACLSKETGLFLPGLLLAAECTVVATRLDPARRALGARLRDVWPLYATCAVIGIAYLAVRRSVLGGFGDDPNTVISLLGHKARLLTMLGVVPEWTRLLVWPARLSADYSPAEISVFLGASPVLIPAALIAAGFIALAIKGWSGDRVSTFGLLWVAVGVFPVSNLVVRSGVIVAERTLFLPSIGALIAVGAAVAWATRRLAAAGQSWPRIAVVPVSLLIALGVAKSAARQRVWRTSDVFLQNIIEDAPRSYRAHFMHGMWLFDKGRRAEGEQHLRRAIAIFPYDAWPYTSLADQYRLGGMCAPARPLYRRALALRPVKERARIGLVACLLHDGDFAEARTEARIGLARGGTDEQLFRQLLALADSALAAQPARVKPLEPLRTAPRTIGSDH